MGSTRQVDQRVASLVKDELTDLDELFAAAESVESLVSSPGWAYVSRIVDAEIAQIDRDLDRGDEPLTRAQYAKKHGRRGGLLSARDVAEAILQRARNEHERQRAKHEGSAESLPEGS